MPTLAQYPRLQALKAFARHKKVSVHLVGGFIRDSWLGYPSADFDFIVPQNAIALARAFAKKIKAAFVLLDADRGCARVVKKNPWGVETFDFSDLRAKSLKKDLQLRDFTINTATIYLNELSDEVDMAKAVDDHLGAQKDLKARRIRMVSAKTFQDDPLRLLRAYSLQAKYGLKIEAKTGWQIKRDAPLLRQVARERVLDEFFKVLESPHAAANLLAMDRIKLLENIIPSITIMYGVKQGGYHHLDVWEHSLETVRQLEIVFAEFKNDDDMMDYLGESFAGGRTRRGLLKLGALLHDIGKPETRKQEKTRMSFHGHEHVGKRIVRSMAVYMKLSTLERKKLEDYVLWHLRPGYLSNFKTPSEKAYFRYFRDTQDEAAAIALLSIADQRSTRGPLTTAADQKHHAKICSTLLTRFFLKKKEKPIDRLLSGTDLIKTLKLKPAPIFGVILKDVEEAQAMGSVTTKEEALALARKIYESQKDRI